MRQSSFRYLGGFDLVLVAAVLAVFGVDAARSPRLVMLLLAGVAAVVAGSTAGLSAGAVVVSWRWFAAASYVLLGAVLPAGQLPHLVAGAASAGETALFAVSCAAAATMLFLAVDIVRGGGHLEVTRDVEGVLGR